ncbi:MAG: hypothetical protein Q7S65_03695, partial [Nanoarchaeota archaeon]|nr:hypothetical protein [Nanoarchaeota archaeon]
EHLQVQSLFNWFNDQFRYGSELLGKKLAWDSGEPPFSKKELYKQWLLDKYSGEGMMGTKAPYRGKVMTLLQYLEQEAYWKMLPGRPGFEIPWWTEADKKKNSLELAVTQELIREEKTKLGLAIPEEKIKEKKGKETEGFTPLGSNAHARI